MTSVLYSAGLNYQNGNPVRTEFNRVNNDINELRKVIQSQQTELNLMKATVNVIQMEREREKAAAKASADAAKATADAAKAGSGTDAS